MDISQVTEKVPFQFFDVVKAVNSSTEAQQKIQDYLQSICQRLLGNRVNLEEHPIHFAISDDENINATFFSNHKTHKHQGNPYHSETLKEIERIWEQTSCIRVTKGLLNAIETEDELAFILGHELGHFLKEIEEGPEKYGNSKLNENEADKNAIDSMIDADYSLDAGMKIVRKIFEVENVDPDYKANFYVSLDAHQNSGTRLNWIYNYVNKRRSECSQKGKDLQKIEPTDLDEKFLETVHQNRYVSKIERELRRHDYYDESKTLAERQEILLGYVVDFFKSEDIRNEPFMYQGVFHIYKEQLHDVLYKHLSALRWEKAKKPIRQSDYDLMMQEDFQIRDKWKEVVGAEWEDNLGDKWLKENTLNSGIFEVVDDDKYEKDLKTYELKKKQEQEKVKDGSDLTLKFFDELCYLKLFDKNYLHLEDRLVRYSMATLKDVNFESLKTGQAVLKQIDEDLKNPLMEETEQIYGILDSFANMVLDGPYRTESYPKDHPSEYHMDKDVILPPYTRISQNLYAHIDPKTYIQNGLTYDEKEDIGKKYNRPLLGRRYMGCSDTSYKVLPNIYSFDYCSNYQNPLENQSADFRYFYDGQKKIIDMCAMKDKHAKIEEMQGKFRSDFNQKIAEILKRDFKTIQEIQNGDIPPDIDVNRVALLRQYVCPREMQTQLSDEELFNERLKENPEGIQLKNEIPLKKRMEYVYHKIPKDQNGNDIADADQELVKLIDSADYYEFDQDFIFSLLSDEEKAFFTQGYVKEADDKLFDYVLSAVQKDIRKMKEAEFPPEAVGWGNKDRLFYVGFTDAQVLKIYEEMVKFLESEKGKEIACLSSDEYVRFFEKRKGETDDERKQRIVFDRTTYESNFFENVLGYSDFRLDEYIHNKIKENPLDENRKDYADFDFSAFKPDSLYRLAKAWGFKSDFSDYKVSERGLLRGDIDTSSLLAGLICKKCDIPPKGEKNILRLGLQRYLLGLYILNSEKDDLPLAEIFAIRGVVPGLSDVVYSKRTADGNLEKFSYVNDRLKRFTCLRKNYPTDPYFALLTFQNVTEKGLMMGRCDFEKASSLMASIINEEQDPKRQLDTSLLFFDCLKDMKSEETNPVKDEIISKLRIFDKEIPLLDRIGAYQILVDHYAFSKDMKMNDQMLEDFLNEINQIEDPHERNVFFDIFISKEHRIDNPVIRRKYFDAWAQSAFDACGGKIDDNSKELSEKAKEYVDKLNFECIVEEETILGKKVNVNKEAVSPIDRDEILRRLSDLFVSQYDMSLMMKPLPVSFENATDETTKRTNRRLIGFDVIKEILKENPKEVTAFIDFLCSKGDFDDARAYHKHLKESQSRITIGGQDTGRDLQEINPSKYFSPEQLQQIHKDYHSHSLAIQAALMSEMLDTAKYDVIPNSFVDALKKKANAGNRDYILPKKETWEHVFDIVAPKVFGNADEKMKEVGMGFLYSFIEARVNDQRSLYLAAMLVAASQNNGEEILKGEENLPEAEQKRLQSERSVAKGVRLFLENLGPAGVKVGQAMASYGAVPEFIRKEMQDLKSNANRPARWEIFEWLDLYKGDKGDGDENLQYTNPVWIGKILGSASYFVTVEKGEMTADGKVPEKTDFVTKILRPSAKIEARREFDIFNETLLNLEKYEVLDGGVSMFSRLINQARSYSDIEMDTEIGYEQCQTAKERYGERNIEFDRQSFKIHVCDWPEGKRGKGWADLERGYGVDLKDIEEGPYKKALSKAYLSTELMMMFSGGQFDHDRHAGQMKIDRKNNIIHIFDTGAMALAMPSQEEKEALGKLIYRTLERGMHESARGEFRVDSLAGILSNEVDLMYQNKEVSSESHYITECMRSLLALKDYYPNPDYFMDAMKRVLENKEVVFDENKEVVFDKENKKFVFDEDIFNGFAKEGVRHLGLFSGENHLLSEEGKKVLGQVLFETLALADNHEDQSTRYIIGTALHHLEEKGVKHPLLHIIHEKMNEKQGSAQPAVLGFDMPGYMLPRLKKVLLSQRLDPKILEGFALSAMDVCDLRGKKDAYSAEDKKAFGALLFDTLLSLQETKGEELSSQREISKDFFDFMKEMKEVLSNGADQEMSQKFVDTFIRLQETKAYPSDLATKVSFVLKLSKGHQGESLGIQQEAVEAAKAILFSGNLDKDISGGFLNRFDECLQGGMLLKSMSRGMLKWFLTETEKETAPKGVMGKMIQPVSRVISKRQADLKAYLVGRIVKFPQMPKEFKKKILGEIHSQEDEMQMNEKATSFVCSKIMSFVQQLFKREKEQPVESNVQNQQAVQTDILGGLDDFRGVNEGLQEQAPLAKNKVEREKPALLEEKNVLIPQETIESLEGTSHDLEAGVQNKQAVQTVVSGGLDDFRVVVKEGLKEQGPISREEALKQQADVTRKRQALSQRYEKAVLTEKEVEEKRKEAAQKNEQASSNAVYNSPLTRGRG